MSLIKIGDATIIEVIKSDTDLVTDKSTRQALAKAKTSAKKLAAEKADESVESDDSETQ
jgi:hypothetical protein